MKTFKELMEAAGLTGGALALAVGVNKTTVKSWVSGRFKVDRSRKAKIEEVLKITLGEADHLFSARAPGAPPGPGRKKTDGGALTRLRERAGLTINRLASGIGAAWVTVQGWERHNVPIPRERIPALKLILGCTDAELLPLAAPIAVYVPKPGEFEPPKKRGRPPAVVNGGHAVAVMPPPGDLAVTPQQQQDAIMPIGGIQLGITGSGETVVTVRFHHQNAHAKRLTRIAADMLVNLDRED